MDFHENEIFETPSEEMPPSDLQDLQETAEHSLVGSADTVSFADMEEFSQENWSNLSANDRMESLKELTDELRDNCDSANSMRDYEIQVADLPDGDFVAVDPENHVITFDRDALELPQAKDSIISDLFNELGIEEHIQDEFDDLYGSDSDDREYASQEEDAQYGASDAAEPHGVSFGCLGICGMECVRYGGKGRYFSIDHKH